MNAALADHKTEIDGDLKTALRLHRSGQLEDAGRIYSRIVAIAPDHCDALHLLGVIAYQKGEYNAAVDLIKCAIDIDSENSVYYNNLGNAFKEIHLLEEAISCYVKATDLAPQYTDAFFNLGNALLEIGRTEEAVRAYQNALKIKPDAAEAHNNLGIALYNSDNLEQAISHFKKALQLKPDYFEVFINLGNAFKKQSRFSEAVDWYHKSIKINPDDPEVYAQMGHALQKLDRLDDAGESYQRALKSGPGSGELHNCLGTVYLEQGRLDEALDCFKKSTILNPQDPEVYCNMGIVLKKKGRYKMAVSSYQKALQLNPDFSTALYNLANIFARCGESEKAIACYRKAVRLDPDHSNALCLLIRQLQQICAWEELPELIGKLNELSQKILKTGDKAAEMPFLTVSLSDDPHHNFQVAKSWAKEISFRVSACSHTFESDDVFRFNNRKKEKSRLKIGYLSADFRNHATAQLMLSLFRFHDRKAFKIFGYSYGPDDDSYYRRRIEKDCDRFRDLWCSNHFEAAKSIYEDGVDILIDLKGYTQDSRLEISAHHPAPIQVSYLGFPGTSGSDFFDYIVTDRITTPPDHAPYFTENFVFMPHCYQVNDRYQKISKRNFTRRDFGLPDQGLVYCSFNEPYKIEPVMFDVWMRLLRKVPDSVLWLLNKDTATIENLKYEAGRRGVAPDRLIFGDKLPKQEHLGRIKMADLYLDTRIYNGHTTISDALWAGVPAITLQGKHFASRVAASILTAAGLPELVTFSLSDYEALAVRLAVNPEVLRSVKEKLAQNRLKEPLFDTSRFAANLEKAYKMMWQIYLNGEEPRQIEVLDDVEHN